MKIWMKPVGAVLIASSLLIGGSVVSGPLSLTQSAYADSDVQRSLINVTGIGEISVKPDIAYLSIGVQVNAATAKEAQSSVAAKIAKLSTLLKGTWKIDAKNIKTGQLYVQPNYTYSEKEGQKINGYTASHTLEVTYRDLDKVGQLLDAATDAGANNINNITFAIENQDQFEAQVIQKAMTNANLKANAIAKAANRQVGVVVNISQPDSGFGFFSKSFPNMAFAAADSAAGTSVEPGEIKVNTSLNVTYEMK